MIREAIIVDDTGDMQISIWEEHFDKVEDGKCYLFTDVSIKYFHAYKLSTRKETVVTEVKTTKNIDFSEVDVDSYAKSESDAAKLTSPTICCPEIMAAIVDIHPVCTNESCRSNIECEAGNNFVNCIVCKRECS